MNWQPAERAIALLFLTVLAPGAAGQTADTDAAWNRLNRLPAGTEIRVALAGGKTLRGFLQNVAPASISINATTSQETVPRTDIKRIQQKRESHRGRNTLIGLGIGAAGGLTAGGMLDAKTSVNLFPNAAKAIFTPLGALIGVGVGAAVPTGGWREVYRAR
jgi:hypothetical protein